MNENNANFTPAAPNFKTLVRMSFQGLTNFPYIEEDFDALTNYELLSKVVEYLNQVIYNNNEQNDLMTSLYNAYVSLQTYVNTYFDNLDLQEEIDNKLDEMSKSGELTTLIKNYIDPLYEPFEDEINTQVENMQSLINTSTENLQNQINHLASGSPLVASSTSGMTDTTRVYVNTTDGKWYYYNGTNWVAGGTYQSTGIADGTIDIAKLDSNYSAMEFTPKVFSDAGLYHMGSNIRATQPLLMKKGTVITFGETFLASNYYRVWKNTNVFASGDIASLFTYQNTPSTYTIPETGFYTIGWRLGDSETSTLDDSPITDNDISLTYYVRNNITDSFDYSFVNCGELMSTFAYAKWNYSKHMLHRATDGIQMSKAFKFDNDVIVRLKDKVTYNYMIMYFDDEKVIESNRGTESGWTTDDVLIPKNTYFSIRFSKKGSLVTLNEVYNNIRIAQNEIDIEGIENDIDSLEDSITSLEQQLNIQQIPSYWESTMTSKISTIKGLELDNDFNGDSLVFITDVHWQNNTKKSPALVQDILKNTNISKVVFGGDVLNLYSSQESAINYYNQFYSAFRGIKMMTVLGNHDFNDNVSGTYPNAHLTQQQVYSINYKKIENDVDDLVKPLNNTNPVKDSFYYYFDNEEQKIRYICLNSAKESYGDNQLAWLKARLMELDSTWSVVIFTHFIFSGLNDGTPMLNRSYTELINYLTANQTYTCEIIGLIAGHTHYDYNITTSLGFPAIVTASDCHALTSQVLGPEMTPGTDTEQCFDVITIDKTNRKFFFTRIGAGNDREISY